MRIFVSYTLKDGYLDTSVLSQVKELYRNCDSCYIDILDNDSVDKQGRVDQELQLADVLLLIETPMVMKSKWVRYELDVAKSRNILIIKSDIKNLIGLPETGHDILDDVKLHNTMINDIQPDAQAETPKNRQTQGRIPFLSLLSYPGRQHRKFQQHLPSYTHILIGTSQ